MAVGIALGPVLPATQAFGAGPSASAAGSGAPSAAGSPDHHPPVMAYYYMWFTPSSWTQRKNDLPALGPYDSTTSAVIAQQVAWAKAAGVDAFVASWKNTPSLDLALSELVAECHHQGLKLVIIYEGLDVNRNPTPATTVAADISWFRDHYAADPVFDVFGKPAVVWSGSWKFGTSDLAMVRAAVGAPDRLLLLGSETSGDAYRARANYFDGDAYYWSSGDPLSTPGYQKRLDQLAQAVHATHGLWLAPVTAGFDGTLNGGTTTVDRRGGQTLTQAWADALATTPDGVAVISWNEYTEASYVEPSQNLGFSYLQVLSSLTGAPAQQFGLLPGSSPKVAGATADLRPSATSSPIAASTPAFGASLGHSTPAYDIWASVLIAMLILAGLVLLGFRMRRRTEGSSE